MKGRAMGTVNRVMSIVLLVSVIFLTIVSCIQEEETAVVQRSLDILQTMSMEGEYDTPAIGDETAEIGAAGPSSGTFYITMSSPLPMRGISLAEDTENGLVVCGAIIETESQEEDIILAHLTSSGEIQWAKAYDRPGLERVEKIVLDDQNNIFMVGWLERENKTSDGFLMKTDPSGNLEWLKTYGSMGKDYLYSLDRTNDGFILAGSRSSKGLAEPWIVRTDSEGTLLWDTCFQISRQSSFYDVKQTSDGGFIMTGGVTGGPDYEESDRSLLKTDSDGNQQWMSTFIGSGNHYPPTYARSVLETPEGNFVSCGSYESIQSETTKNYLWAVDHDGNTLWYKTFSGASRGQELSLCQPAEGGFATTMWSGSGQGNPSGASLVRFDATGALVWRRIYPSVIPDYYSYSEEIITSRDGGFKICGSLCTSYNHREYEELLIISVNRQGKIQKKRQQYNIGHWVKTSSGL